MTKFIDLTGQAFGCLTVVKRAPNKKNKVEQVCFLCKCTCGNEKIISSSDIRRGNTKTCGCHHGLTPKQVITENIVIADNGCWIWQKGKSSTGYGECYGGPKNQKRTHVHSYEIFKGKVPKGMFVCHKCDVRLCCNPDHLFLGTHLMNMTDMKNKNRSPKMNFTGEKNPNSKLKESDIIEIRKLINGGKISVCEIGKMFNVTRTTIREIREKRLWKHV